MEDNRFYAISAEFPQFSNKDKSLVFQFSVKREQKFGCAGAYMKLLSNEIDQKKFGGETPYSIMFGPDICGQNTKKVHAILSRNGKNHMNKKEVPCENDQLTHVYTFIIHPNATYSILIDNKEKETGSVYTDWDILPPKKIKDPESKRVNNFHEYCCRRNPFPDSDAVELLVGLPSGRTCKTVLAREALGGGPPRKTLRRSSQLEINGKQ